MDYFVIKQSREALEGLAGQVMDIDPNDDLEFLGIKTKYPTSDAKKAQEILKKSKFFISLEEYKELKSKSYETENNSKTLTKEAEEAKRTLETSELMVTYDEYKKLLEDSQEKEPNHLYEGLEDLFGNQQIPSYKARQAQEILEKAHIPITLKQRLDLEGKVRLGEMGNAELSDTTVVNSASDILKRAYTVITYQERKELEKQSKERTSPEALKYIRNDNKPALTQNAERAVSLLNDPTVFLMFDNEVFKNLGKEGIDNSNSKSGTNDKPFEDQDER